MSAMTLRFQALRLLLIRDADEKARAVLALDTAGLATGAGQAMDEPPGVPGRPARPLLVSPAGLKPRSPHTREGRAALLHAVAHIERNAIDLALDAGDADARDAAIDARGVGVAVECDLAPCQGATQGAVHSAGDGGHDVVQRRGDRRPFRGAKHAGHDDTGRRVDVARHDRTWHAAAADGDVRSPAHWRLTSARPS